MKWVDLVQKSFALQNLAARVICRLPPAVFHNVEKLEAIRKAFAYTNLEGVTGDYLEFGVYEGTSLVGAINSYQVLREQGSCRFYGYDSFEGLRLDSAQDAAHPVFKEREFATSYERVLKRLTPFQKRNQVTLVRGYFSDTLSRETLRELGVEKARVILIDCDLKSSARDVLQNTAHLWQPGTMLVVDDFFNYRGAPKEGVAGAFAEFSDAHRDFAWRDYGVFGNGGIIRLVTQPPRMTQARMERVG
ncbi:MAG: TylF/MycF/NovP-related O-methyltransferase [Myxococcaceae bacterium]